MMLDELRDYLKETLALTPRIHDWPGARQLPYALRDAFAFHSTEILGREIILAVGSSAKERLTPREIAARLRRIEVTADVPVVYVTATIPAYERARLVAYKTPFIVPAVQMYLPDIGIDFRERVRAIRRNAPEQLAPATQALLIRHLLWDSWDSDWGVTQAASELQYTAMTASRAARELVEAGFFTEQVSGRQRTLRHVRGPRESWDLARPMLRSPVKYFLGVVPERAVEPAAAPLAGLSALAALTMLNAPEWATRAIDVDSARRIGGIRTRVNAGRSMSDGPVYEVWRYPPLPAPGQNTVDPLSLILSLQDEPDARVQGALQELAGMLPW